MTKAQIRAGKIMSHKISLGHRFKYPLVLLPYVARAAFREDTYPLHRHNQLALYVSTTGQAVLSLHHAVSFRSKPPDFTATIL